FKLMVRWTPTGEIKSRSLNNVKTDPTESLNLAKVKVARADRLEQLLRQFLKKVDAETPTLPKRRKNRTNSQGQ
ncbi:MAG: hypothetical protein ABGZ35_21925, partial [Planctomycetaceae bacterium]